MIRMNEEKTIADPGTNIVQTKLQLVESRYLLPTKLPQTGIIGETTSQTFESLKDR